MTIEQNTLNTIIKMFTYYKNLGDSAIRRTSYEKMHWRPVGESNSMAVLVKHMSGALKSRFTDFLTEDGEKSWRHREQEFESTYASIEEIADDWEKSWKTLLTALHGLNGTDLDKIVYIRNEGHTVVEALLRQLNHYTYHVGQLVYVAKMLAGKDWKSLSIPKGKSVDFNRSRFSHDRSRRFFTD